MTLAKEPTAPSLNGGACPINRIVAECPAATPPCPPSDPWLGNALKVMCPKDKAFLDDLRSRGVSITAFDRIYYEDPYYDGSKWTIKHFEGGGSTQGTDMNIVIKNIDEKGVSHDIPAESLASTIYHEGIHTGQPDNMPWSEKEYDAYTKGEQWAINHGLPESFPNFRTTNAPGNPVPDAIAIRKFVDKNYPIATDKPTTPGGSEYKVVGKSPSGDTVIQNINDPPDVKTRPPHGRRYLSWAADRTTARWSSCANLPIEMCLTTKETPQ